MAAVQLTPDAWLSERLGKPAFHLGGPIGPALPADLAGRLERDRIFVDAKVIADDAVSADVLRRSRFSLIETHVTLKCRRDVVPDCSLPGIGFATPDMAEAVGAIAERSFTFDRFHSDRAIPAGAADAIKREWACNYFNGSRGDWMVVAVEREQPVAFLQLLRSQHDDLVIDLIAVDRDHRGKGLGYSMIAFAGRHCPVSGSMIVGTQAANRPSVRLYERIGFRQDSIRHVFHHHGRDQC